MTLSTLCLSKFIVSWLISCVSNCDVRLYDGVVEDIQVTQIGTKESTDMKGFGYGKPLLIRLSVEAKPEIVRLETMSQNLQIYFSSR
jgi:hypothetical protein